MNRQKELDDLWISLAYGVFNGHGLCGCGRCPTKFTLRVDIDFIRKLGPVILFDRDENVEGKAFRMAAPVAVDSGDDD